MTSTGLFLFEKTSVLTSYFLTPPPELSLFIPQFISYGGFPPGGPLSELSNDT